MRTITALELKHGDTFRIPIQCVPLCARSLDHDGYWYSTIDSVLVDSYDDCNLILWCFNGVITVNASQYVHLISE